MFAATEQLLRESSLKDVTVARIISRAQLSRANFYHYFASKYDVVAAMVARLLEDLDASEGPIHAKLGLTHRSAMEVDLRHTIDIWSEHSALICAVIEHIHVVPQLAAAWKLMLDRFVSALVEEITHERATGAAPDGAAAEMIATVLVCGYERSFYVGARPYDTRLPDPESAVDSIIHVTLSAVYGELLGGDRRPGRRKSRSSRRHTPATPPAQRPPASPGGGGDSATATTILEGTRALLAEQSMDQLSVAKILEYAKISRATFYFYFENKDDVFLALFRAIADNIVARFMRLTTIDRTDPDQVESVVIHGLDLDPADFGVLRNAIYEWSHRPGLREAYLATIDRIIGIVEATIDSDRAAGLAVAGPPAPQLAAVLVWTIERSIAGSLAGEAHVQDTHAVAALLADIMVTTIYGR